MKKIQHCYHVTCAECSIVPFPFGRVLFAPSLSPVAEFSNAVVDAEWLRKIRQREAAPGLFPRPSANRNRLPLCDRIVTAFPAKRYLAGAGWRDVGCISLDKQTVTVTETEPWSDNRLAVTVANVSGYSVMNNDVPPVLENLEGKPHKDNPDYIPAYIANPA